MEQEVGQSETVQEVQPVHHPEQESQPEVQEQQIPEGEYIVLKSFYDEFHEHLPEDKLTLLGGMVQHMYRLAVEAVNGSHERGLMEGYFKAKESFEGTTVEK